MRVVEAERIERVAVVEAEVAVAVGIGKGDDALAAEGAVGVEQVGEALVGNLRLDGILHRLLAGHRRQGQEKQSDEILFFHCFELTSRFRR